jgi:quinolinate synthetase A subunit
MTSLRSWNSKRSATRSLANNYQTRDIFHTVADIVGDRPALAREAVRTEADVIVLAGVHFMAETARLLNPDKVVLILELGAGCSLAASITAADIRLLRECYPGVPIVTYVNASAAVEAEADICCTSANAKKIIEALGVPRVIMLADEYLAGSTAAQTSVEIIAWKSIARCLSGSLRRTSGACEKPRRHHRVRPFSLIPASSHMRAWRTARDPCRSRK